MLGQKNPRLLLGAAAVLWLLCSIGEVGQERTRGHMKMHRRSAAVAVAPVTHRLHDSFTVKHTQAKPIRRRRTQQGRVRKT